jgi:hypothetical protein
MNFNIDFNFENIWQNLSKLFFIRKLQELMEMVKYHQHLSGLSFVCISCCFLVNIKL